MSIHIGVFVPANRVPTPEAWTDAASRSGFDFCIEGGVDVHGHDGALPVTCGGVRASFEYYLYPIGEFLGDAGGDLAWLVKLRLRRYIHAAVFVTHSRSDDRFAAVV